MDIVYILGTGSKFNDEEIRYSLRSLKNLPHKKVFIIGEKPDFISDKVIHIPAEDPYQNKQRNAFHKLSIACNTRDISKDFILMNDDFFILKEIKEVKTFHKGSISNVIKRNKDIGGQYLEALKRTNILLGGGIDYSMHYPFIYNKSKLKKVLKKLNGEGAIHLRTYYGNIYSIGGEKMEDIKIKSADDFHRLKHGDVISTNDMIFGSNRFQSLIKNLFDVKCIYEK